MTQTHQPRNLAQRLFWGAVLLLLLWLGLKGWRIAQVAQSLQARPAEAETLLAGGLANADPEAIEALVLGIRRDVVILKMETAVFMPLAPRLDWIPKLGPTIAAAPQLLAMADAGTELGVYALRGFKPAISALQTNPPNMQLIPTLAQTVQDAAPELAAMSRSLDKLSAARTQIDNPDALPQRLRTLLELADEWLPLAQDGLELAPHLPPMLGVGTGGPRRYLIIAQNSDELRPTGGFISGAGLLAVENGRILDLTFLDATQVDNWQAKPYDFPPQPLYNFMGLELFLFRDANFWPDFPTSAEKAIELYSYGQDVPPPDGVIAVDQRFLQLLVEATGPIPIPDSELVINSQNVIENLQAGWAIQEGQAVSDWIFNRKDFIGTFAQAIRDKIESDFAAVDPAVLLQNTLTALAAKDLQIYMRDPAVAAILNDLHWDGRLPTNPPHDFLMVVDSNLGYTKANPLIEQSLTYQVSLPGNGPAQADVTVTWQHTGVDTGDSCTQDVVYNLETAVNYQTLVNRCYWNYLRLYTPPGSQLITSSRHLVPGAATISGQTWDSPAQPISDLNGLTTFANYLMLPRGQHLDAHFVYQLPANVIQTVDGQNQYQLTLFKQAGTRPQPVAVIILLPETAVLAQTTPAPSRVEGSILYFEFELERNTVITVNYQSN